MIPLKTQEEIKIMSEGGQILAYVVSRVLENAKSGILELELDRLAETLILEKGGEPGFKKVKGYNHTICACTNEVVVHGVPSDYRLKEGDVFGLDCGVFYKGFYTDMARTIKIENRKLKIENRKDEIDKFLRVGRHALVEAIKVARVGNRIGHISKMIQEIIEGRGYSVVKSLVGHGLGRKLHEEPEIPGFVNNELMKTPLLKEGMTLAIEVIYNLGKSEVVRRREGPWTIFTKDGSLSATFEDTVAITRNGPLILTR